MISCTDFIPAYSELFCYLEEHYGRDEIDRYWLKIFRPGGGSPLINFVEKEGIRGCFTYWSGTLNEEAADFTMYLNQKRGFFKLVMHRCPSKGRLIDLQQKIGLKPFSDYCLHCDSYRAACEKVGLCYIYDFQNVDNAGCSILIYDPKVFDGRVIIDADTEVMERRASDNVYFHPGFHSSLNRSLDYVGNTHGEAAVRGVLSRYVKNVLLPLMGTPSLDAIQKEITEDYKKENASDVLTTTLTDNTLKVFVKKCPAISYLKENGFEISPWFVYSTTVVMEQLAAVAGLLFEMTHHDENTGEAEYIFKKL